MPPHSRRRQKRTIRVEDEEDTLVNLRRKKQQVDLFLQFEFFVSGMITSFSGILLFSAVRGLKMKENIPYVVVSVPLSSAGLALAYSKIEKWMKKMRSVQVHGHYEVSEGFWFTIFYNNAFYIFLLFFFSHIVFNSQSPRVSFVLTQITAAFTPYLVSCIGTR